jgi:hypothetical protein
MRKEVTTKYVAEDGQRFDSEEACLKHEAYKAVEAIFDKERTRGVDNSSYAHLVIKNPKGIVDALSALLELSTVKFNPNALCWIDAAEHKPKTTDYVFVLGSSGYVNCGGYWMGIAKYDPNYRPLAPWIDVQGNCLSDSGVKVLRWVHFYPIKD